MKRVLSLLLLGMLSATAAAQGLTPPDYTKAEVIAATTFCLETFRKLESNAKRFSMEEFGMPVYSKTDVLNTFTACVLERLENQDAKVVPLA